ncbi:hypothetical protein [Arcobacter sp. CECT 8985]|uniref:hypothetical protein n=1 Tax=Arcobacter sp. CECT 8985 TaxID=1935424 RepID=UPI00100B6684|nr:hypothetical protein [Arcobacter sp. CECT 8985]
MASSGFKYSDTEIEGFSLKINKTCNNLLKSGYDIINITPINSGRYNYKYKDVKSSMRLVGSNTEKIDGGGYGYDYGFGITDGVIIIAKLNNFHNI